MATFTIDQPRFAAPGSLMYRAWKKQRDRKTRRAEEFLPSLSCSFVKRFYQQDHVFNEAPILFADFVNQNYRITPGAEVPNLVADFDNQTYLLEE